MLTGRNTTEQILTDLELLGSVPMFIYCYSQQLSSDKAQSGYYLISLQIAFWMGLVPLASTLVFTGSHTCVGLLLTLVVIENTLSFVHTDLGSSHFTVFRNSP